MEVKKILDRYHGTVVPMSRRHVSEYISQVYDKRDRLSRTDRERAEIYYSEFAYDRAGELEDVHSVFGSDINEGRFGGLFTNRNKYLYAWHDTTGNSFFVNGILSYEHRSRSRTGDGIDGQSRPSLNLVDFGLRVRGTLYGRLGYFVHGANMMVQGDRTFAREDNRIVHSHSFRRSGEDFAEQSMAGIRYDLGIIGLQLARERLEWRESHGSSLFLSDNAPMFNHFRIDLSYGAVNYNYVHGTILFRNYREIENNKYYVANRFEFTVFDNSLQLALNQTTLYSRATPELGYLIPFNILEATERNLGDRDASMIGFDIAVRPVRNFEIKTGMFFDDIHIDKSFTRVWNNMWSVHAGFFYVDAFGFDNLDLTANYTRIEPHVYSHHRGPNLHLQHDGFLMGHPLGPNSDDFLARLEYRPDWQWYLRIEFQGERHGDNLYDEQGELIRNVGGDVFVPWDRDRDSRYKQFLDGEVTRNFHYRAEVRYEIVRQFYTGVQLEYSILNNDHTNTQRRYFTWQTGVWLLL